MKPVIVITVYRRYHELVANLAACRQLFSEFSEQPSVVVVWACPEIPRLWLFKDLLKKGEIDHLLTRPQLSDEVPGTATTYPESHNIRLGLEFVKKTYGENVYAVVQSADVRPKAGKVYKFVDNHMSRESGGAAVFHWDNNCVFNGIWHTNCFAVGMNSKYWPPLMTPGHGDTLELAWGKALSAASLPNILRNHNYAQQRFVHDHQSEKLSPFPVVNQRDSFSLSLHITGRKSWLRRLLERIGVFHS